MQDAPTTLDVLDALATPVLQVGGDGRIRLANEAAARWLRVGRKRLLGLPLAALEREGQAVAGALAQSDGNPHLLRRVQLAFPGSNEALFADLWLSPIA
ncbi:MAG TPA: PAS domain-containing protein, partial [Thermomonas sp.]|nr:PAS domain-containing protein [Thermomonas sp.]